MKVQIKDGYINTDKISYISSIISNGYSEWAHQINIIIDGYEKQFSYKDEGECISDHGKLLTNFLK